jgi:hypothetical protein
MRQLRRIGLFSVPGAITRRLLYVNVLKTQGGRWWLEYPPLHRPSRLCATLRPLARRYAALTGASAAGVAGHEEHVCSSVLKRTGVRLRSHRRRGEE